MRDNGTIGRIEWAVAGRPLRGEQVSGDRCVVLDTDAGSALFAVLDGLGHGDAAAAAGDRAAQVLAQHRTLPLDTLLRRCHRAMADTRGAAMSLAVLAENTVRWLSVGNVTAQILTVGPAGPVISATALVTGGIVGYRLPRRLAPHTVTMRPGDLLLISTDGVSLPSGSDIDVAKPATSITEALIEHNATATDDAMVLAARFRGPRPPQFSAHAPTSGVHRSGLSP